jgi:hypothetical protein
MRERIERLQRWGIVEVFDDRRGAVIETEVRVDEPARVQIVKRRASFTVDCLDCGPSEHVSPDDASFAVCLRCGRDRWL